jgi:multiple sugar transport system permease protein
MAYSERVLRKKENVTGYLFVLPTLIGFLSFVFGPMVAAVILSFFSWDLFTPPKFVGLGNYRALLGDEHLLSVYKNTLILVGGVVSLEIVGGLIVAVLIEQRILSSLKYFLRTTYFFPYVISATAVALVWHLLLNPDLGVVNYYLSKIGIDRINWLFSTQWARFSIILLETWKNIGFYIVVFLAGLQNIPRQLYEAAEVDGANRVQQFFYLTLPLLSPTTFFLIVVGLINAFQIFDMPYVLTRGGPGGATRTVVMYIYETGFRFFNMGYAATVSLSLFVFIAVLTFIQFRMSGRWVFYR